MNFSYQKITDIAEQYKRQHESLPLIVILHKQNGDSQIVVGKFRDKFAEADQETFLSVLRLAMIVTDVTHYDFVMKPDFNHEQLQMTKNVYAIGNVSPEAHESAFFELDEDVLIPYYEKMQIGGMMGNLLPSESDRAIAISDKAKKQLLTYIKNATYTMPVAQEQPEESGMDALINNWK